MEFGGPRKRGRQDGSFNGNGGHKKSRSESESFQPGVGSKSKPCTKFFSTSGCPFGEGCHFLHHVPGGYKAVSQMLNLPALSPQSGRNNAAPPFFDTSSAQAGKLKMCSRYNSPEGCKFGDKCHYAHGEWELGRPSIAAHEDPRGGRHMSGRMGRRMEPAPPGRGDFGTSATIKITIDASLVGSVIGKSGSNTKQISRVTGVKLSVRDHESDPNLKNVELEGSFDQIQQANSMVRELIANVKSGGRTHQKHPTAPGGGSNLKTKLCERFAKGNCTFGDKCYFAHGAEELRTSAA
ncbi:hypothetical protein vseg_008594 [Gypsophila vaccaria]